MVKQVPLHRSASQLGFINPLHVEVASIGTVPSPFALFLFYDVWRGFREGKWILGGVNNAFSLIVVYVVDFYKQVSRLGQYINHARYKVLLAAILRIDFLNRSVPFFSHRMSPLVITCKRPDNQPDVYLQPDNTDFGRLLLLKLVEQYCADTRQDPSGWWNVEQFVNQEGIGLINGEVGLLGLISKKLSHK
jgi:hypothetical protein